MKHTYVQKLLRQELTGFFEERKKKSAAIKGVGNAILLASIQASIGSVEMSSKFSVVNFSKDQMTLQAAADALTGYIIIAIIWTVGAVFLGYGHYGWFGFASSLIANLVMMGWIVGSYCVSFQVASKRYGLEFPKLMRIRSDTI